MFNFPEFKISIVYIHIIFQGFIIYKEDLDFKIYGLTKGRVKKTRTTNVV